MVDESSPRSEAKPPLLDLPSSDATAGSWMVRGMHFMVLLALAVSVLAYPLCVEEGLYRATFGRLVNVPVLRQIMSALDPLLRYRVSPLALKETLTGWVLLFLVAFWICWKLFDGRSGRLRARPDVLCLFGLLVWCLISMLRAPHFGLDSSPAYSAVNVSLWTLFLVAALDLPWADRFVRRAVGWLLGISAVLMLVSLAQATKGVSDLLFKIMLKHGTSPWNRNLYGSLIGHNTGVASACLGPFFFALGLLFHSRRLLHRVLLSVFVVVSVIFFVVTQSRAVWALAVLLTPVFLVCVRHTAVWRPRIRYLVIGLLALALVTVTQIVPSRVNVLNIQPAEYMSRIEGMRPEIVLRGTRARILAVLTPWVARRPIAGYGLAAFPVVYPAAQAEYFNKHLDTPLRLTDRSTGRAHNDYLQTALETGFVGLGLALAGLFFAGRAGLRRLREAATPGERLVRICAGFGALGILLHATIDFPFHIAPLATLFCVYIVLFAGPRAGETLIAASVPRIPGARIALFAVVALAIWAAVGFALGYTSRRLLADIREAGGTRLFNQATPKSDQRRVPANRQVYLLSKAREEYRRSLRIDPLQFETTLRQVHANYGLADIHISTAFRQRARGNTAGYRATRQAAIGFIDSAHAQLRHASCMSREFRPFEEPYPVEGLGPRVNLPLLMFMARTWRLFEEIGHRANEAPRRTYELYRKAVYYRPNQIAPIEELLDIMWRHGLGGDEERAHFLDLHRRALSELRETGEEVFVDRCAMRLDRLIEQERYGEALGVIESALAIQPDMSLAPAIPRAMAHIGLLEGDTALMVRAAEVLRKACPGHPEIPMLDAVQDIVAGRYEAAAVVLHRELSRNDGYWHDNPAFQRLWWFALSEIRQRQGRVEEATRFAEVTLAAAPTRSAGLAERGRVRLGLFHDREGGMADFLAALDASPPVRSSHALLDLIRYLSAKGDTARLERAILAARRSLSRNPALGKLLQSIRTPQRGVAP